MHLPAGDDINKEEDDEETENPSEDLDRLPNSGKPPKASTLDGRGGLP